MKLFIFLNFFVATYQVSAADYLALTSYSQRQLTGCGFSVYSDDSNRTSVSKEFNKVSFALSEKKLTVKRYIASESSPQGWSGKYELKIGNNDKLFDANGKEVGVLSKKGFVVYTDFEDGRDGFELSVNGNGELLFKSFDRDDDQLDRMTAMLYLWAPVTQSQCLK